MPEEAKILGLLGNAPSGMTLAEICSGTGILSEDALTMCQRLEQQQLIDCEAEICRLKPHLENLAREAT
jgi:DNA-binding IclR family transcriptional regulator